MSVQLPAATSDKFKKVRRLYDVQGFPGIAAYAIHPTNPWLVVCYHDGTFFVHNVNCTSMKPITQGNLAESLTSQKSTTKLGLILDIKFYPAIEEQYDIICLTENFLIFINAQGFSDFPRYVILENSITFGGRQTCGFEVIQFENKNMLAIYSDGLKLFDPRDLKIKKITEKVPCKTFFKLTFFKFDSIPILAVVSGEFNVTLYNCKTDTILSTAVYKEFRDLYYDPNIDLGTLFVLTSHEITCLTLTGMVKKSYPMVNSFHLAPFYHPAYLDSHSVVLATETELILFDRNSPDSMKDPNIEKVIFHLSMIGVNETSAKIDRISGHCSNQLLYIKHNQGISLIALDVPNMTRNVVALKDNRICFMNNQTVYTDEIVCDSYLDTNFRPATPVFSLPQYCRQHLGALLQVSPSKQYLIVQFKRSSTYVLIRVDNWEVIAQGSALDVGWCNYKDCFVVISLSALDEKSIMTARSTSTNVGPNNKGKTNMITNEEKSKGDKSDKSKKDEKPDKDKDKDKKGVFKKKDAKTDSSKVGSQLENRGSTEGNGKNNSFKDALGVGNSNKASKGETGLKISVNNLLANMTGGSPVKDQIWFSIREIDPALFRAKTIDHKLFENIIPLQIFGGPFVGLKFGTRNSKKTFLAFYTWKKPSMQVLAPLIAPLDVVWDTNELLCLLVYEDYFKVYSAKDGVFQQLCKVEQVSIVHAMWHRSTLFYATYNQVYCFFPCKKEIFLQKGILLPFQPFNSKQSHKTPIGFVSLISFNNGVLTVMCSSSLQLYRCTLDSPKLKCFCLIQTGLVSEALKWVNLIHKDKDYQDIMYFLKDRGYQAEALKLPQVPLSKKLFMCLTELQYTFIPEILQQRILEIIHQGCSPFEIDSLISLILEFIQAHCLRTHALLFQQIYLILAELDHNFYLNYTAVRKYIVERSSLFKEDIPAREVSENLKKTSVDAYLFYDSLITHCSSTPFQLSDWEPYINILDNKPNSLFNVKLASQPFRQIPYLDDVQKYSRERETLKLYFVSAEQKELARKLKDELKKKQQSEEVERKKALLNSPNTSTSQLDKTSVSKDDVSKSVEDKTGSQSETSHTAGGLLGTSRETSSLSELAVLERRVHHDSIEKSDDQSQSECSHADERSSEKRPNDPRRTSKSNASESKSLVGDLSNNRPASHNSDSSNSPVSFASTFLISPRSQTSHLIPNLSEHSRHNNSISSVVSVKPTKTIPTIITPQSTTSPTDELASAINSLGQFKPEEQNSQSTQSTQKEGEDSESSSEKHLKDILKTF